ncbi:MAG: site-specific DNA-methyltransferase [Spirochaetales bacterium]|nr:site-specific DNA-methyltransferase [Spirochaetales bacterium]
MASRIEMWQLDKLRPYDGNARTHSPEQVDQIAASIVEFGFNNPVLVDSSDGIVAGHGRLLAARKLGMPHVPVVVLDHLSDAQKRAYVIADNKLAEQAGWDNDLLKEELTALQADDFDLSLVGFSDEELSGLLDSWEEGDGLTEDEAVPETPNDPVSRPGDIWVLGDHRVGCGDATSKADLALLLDGGLADLVFTDPPYNVAYVGGPGPTHVAAHKEILNDNLGGDFEDFLGKACGNFLSVCTGSVYICMSSSEIDTLKRVFTSCGGHWSTFLIWAKNRFTLGRSDYQRQYEPILYGWPKGAKRFWCGDRNQGDVWFFDKPTVNDLHPTMKPVDLIERAITNSSKRGDVVLDPFGGSGSTLIAAEKTGRQARLLELDPGYVDVIVNRWQDFSGGIAVTPNDGRSFADLAAERRG